MKSRDMRVDPARTYPAKEYWTGLAQGIPSADTSGFAPVLHPDAPLWFNRLIDDLQFRAIRRALALGGVRPGARILDVGCGTGRWVRRYHDLGLRATGVDATPPMLRLARERGTTTPVVAGEAQRLPFADAQFDFVSDITVIQHIPASLQDEALGEMTRVLKPGGRLILMELIRGEGTHIFPRTAAGWIEQATSHGIKLLGWFGQEYLLLDRLFVHTARAITARNGSSVPETEIPEKPMPRHSPAARRLYWMLRRVTAGLSAWADPVVEAILPGEIATHGVFVFQK
jgi:SAM-dependent methyltransferase